MRDKTASCARQDGRRLGLRAGRPAKPSRIAVVLRIGPIGVSPPVVLAPMAGVTNAPFRALCRRYGGGLYVSEMVMARAYIEGGEKTRAMVRFAPGESPRSMQLYGSDPLVVGEAVRQLAAKGEVDHLDMNFGCPAAKVTRKGGGAAVPAKPRLMRRIIEAAVVAAEPYGVPITIKFRKGLNDSLLTFLDTGRIAAESGVAAIALHARTAEQLYSGTADWDAIAQLKQAVPEIPVLGNGDIWEAQDAIDMTAHTGCDGVVVGRGCLGRPWLFADLAAALDGKTPPPPPPLGEVMPVMAEHARMLVDHYDQTEPAETGGSPGKKRPGKGIRDFRKHAGWYLTGYAVGPLLRQRFSQVASLDELDDLLSTLDPALTLPPGGQRIKRGHTNGPRPVHLPDRYLENLDDDVAPCGDDVGEAAASGG